MSNSGDSFDRLGLSLFLGSVIFCIGFFGYISFMHKNVTIDELKEYKAVSPGFDMAKVEMPWVESADVATYGAKVYQNNCAVCHGKTGLGDGAALNPPPRNLVKGDWKRGGTSIDLYTTLQKGLEGTAMVSFAHLAKNDRWALVQFIRSITQNKGADDEAKLKEFGATAN